MKSRSYFVEHSHNDYYHFQFIAWHQCLEITVFLCCFRARFLSDSSYNAYVSQRNATKPVILKETFFGIVIFTIVGSRSAKR